MTSNLRFFGKSAFILFSVLTFVSCSAGGGDDDDQSGNGVNSDIVFTQSASTNGSGVAEFDFQVADGVTKFSIVAEVNSNSVSFLEIEDDSGNNYLNPNSVQLSEGDTPISLINSVTVPSRAADPIVNSARIYTVRAYASDSSGFSPESGVNIRLTVIGQQDSNLSNGTMNVNVFYVGSIAQSTESKNAVETAISEFTRIYRDEANVAINIRELDMDGPNLIPDPVDGSSIYTSASSQVTQPSISILVAGDISGFEGEIYGIAGGIPGPPKSSIHSGVAVSLLTSAGPNGTFSNTELRVLGETLAHETGHYLGLFHPADFNGNFVSNTDPLSDTQSCNSLDSCDSNNSLITNLMYATPIEDNNGGLVPQNQLTSQQAGVVNRYIAVD